MQTTEELDTADLVSLLITATREAFTALKKRHRRETFYAFTLFTSPDLHAVSPLAFGGKGLAEAADDDDDLAAEMRWSTGDSPYLEEVDDHFDEVNDWLGALPDVHGLDLAARRARTRALHGAYRDALAALDAEGFFGRGAAREAIVLNILQGDQSNRSRLENAAALNPPEVMRRLAAELPVTRPVGRHAALGPTLRSVTAVAARADLIVFCSGRSLNVYRDGHLAFERDCEIPLWCLALTPDSVLAGAESELVRVPLGGGPITREPRHGERIISVAASRDGRTIATYGWDERVVVTRDGVERWRRDDVATEVAIDPDGRFVVVGGKRVSVIDAADGAVVGTREAKRRRAFERVAVAHDGRVAAAVDAHGKHGLALFDASGALVAQRHIPDVLPESAKYGDYNPRECTALAFSPSGTHIASAHTSGELHLWDGATARRLTTMRGTHERATGCAWLDDARVALVGSDVDGAAALTVFDVA